jgi:hypothetical protein
MSTAKHTLVKYIVAPAVSNGLYVLPVLFPTSFALLISLLKDIVHVADMAAFG